jgi:hypothetical protein
VMCSTQPAYCSYLHNGLICNSTGVYEAEVSVPGFVTQRKPIAL